MKKYEMPEMKVISISTEDVIRTSGQPTGGGASGDFGGMGGED